MYCDDMPSIAILFIYNIVIVYSIPIDVSKMKTLKSK